MASPDLWIVVWDGVAVWKLEASLGYVSSLEVCQVCHLTFFFLRSVAEPGAQALARLAGQQALRICLSLCSKAEVTGT